MTEMLLLDPVQVLQGPGHSVEIGGAALFEMAGWKPRRLRGRLVVERTSPHKTPRTNCSRPAWWMHIRSCTNRFKPGETLSSLMRSAGAGGFGQIALMPDGDTRRERPEHLQGFS